MSSCCHFSSRSSGVWEGNMFQWSSCDPQIQRERDLCRISSSLTGEDPALMYGTVTSIIKQSAGSLRRLIGSSITGCDQSHLFLSSAQLSPTDKMEVKAAEHKKTSERQSVNMHKKYFTSDFIHSSSRVQINMLSRLRTTQVKATNVCFNMISEQSETIGWLLNKPKLQTHVVNSVPTALKRNLQLWSIG